MKTKNLLIILLVFAAMSCSGPVARKPISKKTNVFLKASVALNKTLNDRENSLVQTFMALDSLHIYKESSLGFWYAIEKSNLQGSNPVSDDIVLYTYEVYNLKNELLYPKDSMHANTFKIDKQSHKISGIQEGLKIMKVGEQAVFLFPSFKAYGLTGDGEKIGVNEPIKVIIELIKIQK